MFLKTRAAKKAFNIENAKEVLNSKSAANLFSDGTLRAMADSDVLASYFTKDYMKVCLNNKNLANAASKSNVDYYFKSKVFHLQFYRRSNQRFFFGIQFVILFSFVGRKEYLTTQRHPGTHGH